MKLGIAGHLTRAFIGSALTPLFLLAAFAVGLVALVTLPREEEPQISVPMVDIHVSAPGLKAEDAEKLINRIQAVVLNALEDFHDSEPYVPGDDDDEDDQERGMGM